MRVGVVGVNGIGQAHLWALRTTALAAVCDIDDARAQKAGTDHDVPRFTDARELYTSGVVDAVVIATPAGTHAQLVRDALDAGVHVYCEKPITPVADDGYVLAQYARDRQLVLHVGFQMRFHLGYTALRVALADLGNVRRVHLSATNWFRAQRYFDASPWRATWRMAGGGVLMNQAVHQLDALITMLGLPAQLRAEVRKTTHRAEVEDDARVELQWNNGARGTIVASLAEPAGGERFEFFCDDGAVQLVDGYDVRVARHDPVQQQIDELAEEFPADAPPWSVIDVPRAKSEWFDMIVASHAEFARAIEEKRPSIIDGDSGTRSVELANAIYLSDARGESVELPLTPGEYASVFEELAAGRRVLRL